MAKKKQQENKHAIDSIYTVEEKKSLSPKVIFGLVLAGLILIVIVLAAISMKSGSTLAAKQASENYNVSILGNINAKTVSLPLLSIVLGFVDGFNPCAMWILVFLILMMMEMNNRKKMWILGGTFLITSALIYLVFMVSWLNVAMFLTGIKLVRYAIGLFAIVFGVVNIARFFKMLKEDDGCDVTDGKKRSKIMATIKKIVNEKSFTIAFFGIIALAAGVNLLELLCSLGIPVVFTQVLALNDLNVVQYTIYVLLYLIFFMIDDFIVFIIAMTTFKVTGISNKYTKFSHLIGGIFMALLGILMIVKPAWIMFNFNSDNVEVVKKMEYGEFIKNAELSDINFDDDKFNIYLFWGDGCPHCADLYSYLNELRNQDYGLYFNFYGFETWYDKDNQELMELVADEIASKDSVTGVPFFVVGSKTFVGYSSLNENDIKTMIDNELAKEKHIDVMKLLDEDGKIDLDGAKNTTTTTTTTTTTVTTTTTKKKKK